MYKDIVIVSAVRTPFGRYGGSLMHLDYFDLGVLPMKVVLARANLDGSHVMEINEAFAAVPLLSTLLLADKDRKKSRAIQEKTNINGSAITIGHPNTASGARLMMNLMYELPHRGGGYAMGAICGGLGQADACVIKV